jgi:hypothetical protein
VAILVEFVVRVGFILSASLAKSLTTSVVSSITLDMRRIESPNLQRIRKMDNDGPQNEMIMKKTDASKKHRRLLPAG